MAAKDQLERSGRYESLAAAFQAARYAFEKIDPAGRFSRGVGHFAANPGQRFRFWLGKDGIEIADASARSIKRPDPAAPPSAGLDLAGRQPDTDAWNLSLRLRGFGRAGHWVGPGKTLESLTGAARMEMTHSEIAVTQWFENRTDGVEHGFTVNHRPAGKGALELVMSVGGGLHLAPSESGIDQGVRFVDNSGADAIHYTGLKAWDAGKRALPARMEIRGSELALVVDETNAAYPITIDPLFAVPQSRFTSGVMLDDQFGASVAVSGNTALVGVPGDDGVGGLNVGSAYVLLFNGSTWVYQARLLSADPGIDDAFGAAVALEGDTAVIAAPYSTANGSRSGSVCVFFRTNGVWTQQARLVASDFQNTGYLGESVSVSGDLIIAGARGMNTPQGNAAGAAYVYVRSGSTWTQEARLLAADGAASDQFGATVAISNNTAVVGKPYSGSGSVYAFVRSGSSWSQQAKMSGPGPGFGRALSLSGNTALIGVPDNSSNDHGTAQVFVRSGSTWTQQAQLTASDGGLLDRFGCAVTLSGDTALIGAYSAKMPSGSRAGAAYVFTRAGTQWTQQTRLTAANGRVNDRAGMAVALSGTTALVGAPFANQSNALDAGRVYVYSGSGTSWSQQTTLNTHENSNGFGGAVALENDTAVIGAPADSSAVQALAGAAYVLVRSGGAWSVKAKLTSPDGDLLARSGHLGAFGRSVALQGDTLIVGESRGFSPSPQTPGIWRTTGSAYAFVRNNMRWDFQAKLAPDDGGAEDDFGASVALSGNTVAVGSPSHDSAGGANSGRCYVFRRDNTTWTLESSLVPGDAAPGTYFGRSVAISNNTLLVGAPVVSKDALTSVGAAYVFEHVSGSWAQTSKLMAGDISEGDYFGVSVALSNDAALVGANMVAGSTFGKAYIFVRNELSWTQHTKLTPSDAGYGYYFGSSVSITPDLILVGAPRAATPVATSSGAAYVFKKAGNIWNPGPKLTAGVTASSGADFGGNVALSGNTALVGASQEVMSSSARSGSAYAFLLGDLPEIMQQPASRTVVPGVSVTFAVTVTGYSPLTYEWRKNGTAIGGATAASYTLPAATTADAGQYDVVVSNLGGTVTSAPATLTVNALPRLAVQFPGTALDAQGFMLVNLAPGGLLHGWRFIGEQQWRASGVPVGGLTTGDREIEFRPVPGHIQPPQETVSVISGEAATVLARDYFVTATTGSGGLSVTLKPDSILTGNGRAQWRLLGENDSQWRDSGGMLTGLIPGSYLIECKTVAGRATPPPANVIVSNAQTAVPTITYFLPDSQTGTPPSVLAFEAVTTDTTKPYAHVGQIRSNVGASTGFVVKARVVATAAHVVWDDGTLTAAQGLQWLFQRHRGSYEPKPILPRGIYLFDGYAAQRVIDNSPGDSSPESQHLDVAAIYFNEDAGRGGYGGFLASDLPSNEFLLSNANKMLVGYPVDGIAATSQGRMHATAPGNVAFSAAFGRTYTTTGIRSSGGNSGGPLCVQFENGNYYPAAIYLGGNAQTVVRTIDSTVIDLFNRAEVSGTGGGNNTGGGITHTSLTTIGGGSNPGILQVIIQPAGAVGAGAGWRLAPETAYRASGAQKSGLNVGSYMLQFATVPGYQPPASQSIAVVGGQLSTVTFTYALPMNAQESWRQTHFGSGANTGNGADTFDADGDGYSNLAEYTAGTHPTTASDHFKAQNPTRGAGTFSLSTAGKAGRAYELQRCTSLAPGSWIPVATQGPLTADAPVTLTDSTSPDGSAFYRISVTVP